eukprot:CAMPEP_0179244834 /NCGR_PEP_ID=MMETSP0797-20121207/18260_1 /TAXON_ID=47934 /ORGANISM="Dinophysis acuminata, Strain DAEP01" /LENGTH=409 /DNA_ID=CAMNT_0020952359 /DNA_START=69 /DNA_END=1298 /DNA_ORIENTATION=+
MAPPVFRPLGAALLLVGAEFATAAKVDFEERFDTEEWEQRWVPSMWKGNMGPAGKFKWSAGDWFVDEKVNKGIMTSANMQYHTISAKLAEPFSNQGRDLVVQFSAKHESQEFSFCGGGYMKLLGKDIDQPKFGGDTDYMIMFGPDICGYDVARIHLILNWKGKNLLKKEDIKLDYDDKNEYTHLYTLVLKPDNTYEVYFDQKLKASGSLHGEWDFPNRTSDDPSDKKPADWVDLQKIDDPSATKPSTWEDEPRIRDPTATKPEEWDDEEDGEWEKPMINNPNYKGAWFAEKVDNPEYKGAWAPKQLANPEFVEDVYHYKDIGAVGFELWTVNKGSIFDNILVCDSLDHAKAVANELWKPTSEKEKAAKEEWKKKTGKSDAADSKDDGGDDEDDDDASEVDLDKKAGSEL